MPPKKSRPRAEARALSGALENLRHGDHALLVCRTPAARAAALVAFARGALGHGQKVVIIVPQAAFMEQMATLQKLSTLDGLREFSGQFALLPKEEILGEAAKAGAPGDPRAFLEEYSGRALREGWRGVRFAHVAADSPDRGRWEAVWDHLARGTQVVVLCAYPMPRGQPPPAPPEAHNVVLGLNRAFPARRGGP